MRRMQINTGLLAVLTQVSNVGDVVIPTEVRHHDAGCDRICYELAKMA